MVVLLANPYLFQEEEGPISVILKVDITIYDIDTSSRTQISLLQNIVTIQVCSLMAVVP